MATDPYLQQNASLLNLRQQNAAEEENNVIHDIISKIATTGDEPADTHIVTTSEVDNYFNLQITT